MIEKLSWRAIYLLCGCLAVPVFYIGWLMNLRFGMFGNFALASLVVLIGVPWAFRSSSTKGEGGGVNGRHPYS